MLIMLICYLVEAAGIEPDLLVINYRYINVLSLSLGRLHLVCIR
jgi:hypothetical protein